VVQPAVAGTTARRDFFKEHRAMPPQKWKTSLLLVAVVSTLFAFAVAAPQPQVPAWKSLFNGKENWSIPLTWT